jgi:hypothetical protein
MLPSWSHPLRGQVLNIPCFKLEDDQYLPEGSGQDDPILVITKHGSFNLFTVSDLKFIDATNFVENFSPTRGISFLKASNYLILL